jgi:FAD dependent monooxygenase
MDSADPTPKPFRVVVVGAGIVGLSVSHALQLANIDHVVLEKYEQAVTVRGASLVILPNGARALDQFGVLSKIHQTTSPVNTEFRRWPDGSLNTQGSIMMTLNAMYARYPCQ